MPGLSERTVSSAAKKRYQLNQFGLHLKIRVMDGFDDLNACFVLIQGILIA